MKTTHTQPALPIAYQLGDAVHLPHDDRPLTVTAILDVDYGLVSAIVAGHCDYDPTPPERIAIAKSHGWPGTFCEDDGATPYTGRLYYVTGRSVFAYRKASGLRPG